MNRQTEKQRPTLRDAMKSVSRMKGKGKPKIGVAEFMSIAERFGLSAGTRRAIRALLEKENWGSGPFLANYLSGLKQTKVQAYEAMARRLFGVPYAIAASSGTGSLHAAFAAVGVGPGTEVICPAIGFFATASAVVMARGIPVFCDVDESLAMDPAKIEQVITPRTVAIAPTHVMGSVCNMGAIMKVARRHGLRVVEDCAQSSGARWHGRPVGTIGDMGCFSISAYKIVGGGEGGLILTSNERLWERASQMVESGGLWRPERFAPPRYEGELFCGTNYRLSELEAAISVVQLRRMGATVRRFRSVKQRIIRRLRSYREIVPQKLNDPNGEVGYLLRFFPETVELAERIAAALKAEGIACSTRGRHARPDWHLYSYMYPVLCKTGHTEANCPFECPVYRKRGGRVEYARGDCPVADDLFDRMVSVNLNQWYSAQDCRNIAAVINKVLSALCTEAAAVNAWI